MENYTLGELSFPVISAKVLAYSSGPTENLVDRHTKFMEILPNIYLSIPDTEGYTNLIFKFVDCFVMEGSYQISRFKNFEDEVKNQMQIFYDGYFGRIENSKWISTIYIELYKRINKDWQTLLNKRNEIIVQRENDKLAKIHAGRIAAQDQAEKWEKHLTSELIKLKKGELIDREIFLQLCKKHGVNIHIRTIGLLNSLGHCKIGISSADISCKKGKNPNFDKVFKAAKELAAILVP